MESEEITKLVDGVYKVSDFKNYYLLLNFTQEKP